MKPEELTGIGALLGAFAATFLSLIKGKATTEHEEQPEEKTTQVSASNIDSIFKLQSEMIRDISEQLAIIKKSDEERANENEKLKGMVADIRGQYQELQESFNKLSIQNSDLIAENKKLSQQVEKLNRKLGDGKNE